MREVYADIFQNIELDYLEWDLRSAIQWVVTNRLGLLQTRLAMPQATKEPVREGKVTKFGGATKCYIKDRIQTQHKTTLKSVSK